MEGSEKEYLDNTSLVKSALASKDLARTPKYTETYFTNLLNLLHRLLDLNLFCFARLFVILEDKRDLGSRYQCFDASQIARVAKHTLTVSYECGWVTRRLLLVASRFALDEAEAFFGPAL